MADVELEQVFGEIDDGVAYRAQSLTGEHFLYVVTQKSGHWTYERSELSVGPFIMKGQEGRVTNGDDAYTWVQNDWPQFRNALRWAIYMVNNPPPA